MDGLAQFVETLGQLGGDGLSLPQETTGVILREARRRGWTFDDAWSIAINRLQVSSVGGTVDPVLESDLRETRAILEECRPHFRAAYHRADPSPTDLAVEIVRAWDRIDGPVPVPYLTDVMDEAYREDARRSTNGHRRNGATGRGFGPQTSRQSPTGQRSR